MRIHVAGRLGAAASILLLGGCASLLPRGAARTDRPWGSYAQAHAAYAAIIPYVTTLAALRSRGVDPDSTPNVQLLSYADILRDLVPAGGDGVALDRGIRDCLREQQLCVGYAIAQRHVENRRIGNFWADFLNFRRETRTRGWQYRMLVLSVNGRIVYKTWGGEPHIAQDSIERNPLGPLQSIGDTVVRRF